jgi:hypothetical protein
MKTTTGLLAAVLIFAAGLLLGGCGDGGTAATTQAATITTAAAPTTQETTATTDATTTAAETISGGTPESTTGAAVTLDAYRAKMKSLVDKHDAEMAAGLSAFREIMDVGDASDLTDAQSSAVAAFSEELKDLVSDMETINTPEELATSHATVLDGYRKISAAATEYLQALRAKDEPKMMAALTNLGYIDAHQIDEAEGQLEEALGFTLGSIRASRD